MCLRSARIASVQPSCALLLTVLTQKRAKWKAAKGGGSGDTAVSLQISRVVHRVRKCFYFRGWPRNLVRRRPAVIFTNTGGRCCWIDLCGGVESRPFGREEIHLLPSGEMPPPGMIMWTWGWSGGSPSVSECRPHGRQAVIPSKRTSRTLLRERRTMPTTKRERGARADVRHEKAPGSGVPPEACFAERIGKADVQDHTWTTAVPDNWSV